MILGANSSYTATLEGVPPVEFSAVKTCAPKVVVVELPPALANTGSGDLQPLMWGGALTTFVATGLLLTLARRGTKL